MKQNGSVMMFGREMSTLYSTQDESCQRKEEGQPLAWNEGVGILLDEQAS